MAEAGNIRSSGCNFIRLSPSLGVLLPHSLIWPYGHKVFGDLTKNGNIEKKPALSVSSRLAPVKYLAGTVRN